MFFPFTSPKCDFHILWLTYTIRDNSIFIHIMTNSDRWSLSVDTILPENQSCQDPQFLNVSGPDNPQQQGQIKNVYKAELRRRQE